MSSNGHSTPDAERPRSEGVRGDDPPAGAPRPGGQSAIGKIAIIGAIVVAAIIAVMVALRSSPSGGPVAIEYGRDMCAECRMHLSEKGFAAQVREPSGEVLKYDDIGCLLEAIRKKGGGIPEGWVEDHGSGAWVPLKQAVLVRGGDIKTPMNYGVVAFKDEAAAKTYMAAHGGNVVALNSLIGGGSPAAGGSKVAKTAQPGSPRPFTEADWKEGKALYLRDCSACHGERSDGEGPAAAHIDPRPRNFLKEKFKLRSTPSGKPPATADVLRVIERGIPGTAMPAFNFLPAEERRLIAAYVLEKADLREGIEPEPIPDPGPAPAATPELVARGKQVYADLGCASCHGETGKGDGSAARTMKDELGRPVPPRDFTNGVFRGGSDPKDLYDRFVAGMDGSAMPAFGDSIKKIEDRWALVHFVLSLRSPRPAEALPADPIAAGRVIVAKYNCQGCHILDDGKGGDVGPDLRVAGQKLDAAWVTSFLKNPRQYGKIYPWRVWRMPHLGITEEEAGTLTKYIMAMGERQSTQITQADASKFDDAKLNEGKNFFLLRCTECHNLGKVIEIPEAKRQGPDLINVTERVDFEWAKGWILDPKKIDPKTRMTVPGITPEQADSVRMFVWKTAMDQKQPRK